MSYKEHFAPNNNVLNYTLDHVDLNDNLFRSDFCLQSSKKFRQALSHQIVFVTVMLPAIFALNEICIADVVHLFFHMISVFFCCIHIKCNCVLYVRRQVPLKI